MTTLHNDHNVYILGAGFSADRGLPVVKDFMLAVRDAHEWLIKVGRNDEASAIAKVLQYRLKAASAAYRVQLDLENIEELFSLAAASNEALTADICKAIAATLDYRLKTRQDSKMIFRVPVTFKKPDHWLSSNQTGNVSTIEAPLYEYYLQAMLGKLLSNELVGENTFITFNYDTLVEESLRALGVEFSYGFKSKRVNYAPSATDLGHHTNAQIKVYKLHGSTNWTRPGGIGGSGKLRVYREYSELVNSQLTPVIIPPTWRKQFANQLLDIWNGSISAIEKATRLIIIGFSMPDNDAHFKYLMAAGLQNNLSLREIVFVNPEAKLLQEKLGNLFGARFSRVELTGGRVDGFLSPGWERQQISYYGRSLHSDMQSFGVKRN